MSLTVQDIDAALLEVLAKGEVLFLRRFQSNYLLSLVHRHSLLHHVKHSAL